MGIISSNLWGYGVVIRNDSLVHVSKHAVIFNVRNYVRVNTYNVQCSGKVLFQLLFTVASFILFSLDLFTNHVMLGPRPSPYYLF